MKKNEKRFLRLCSARYFVKICPLQSELCVFEASKKRKTQHSKKRKVLPEPYGP